MPERERTPTAADLFEAHAADVYGYLWRRSGQEADDLLSEVFTVVVRRIADFDPSLGGALPWLYAIAYRVLGADHRRRGRRDLLIAALAQRPTLEDPWEDVDERLDARRLGHSLTAALLALPEEEREILLLVACEQLSPTEAARVIGVPAGTARSRLHRARLTLRPDLEESR